MGKQHFSLFDDWSETSSILLPPFSPNRNLAASTATFSRFQTASPRANSRCCLAGFFYFKKAGLVLKKWAQMNLFGTESRICHAYLDLLRLQMAKLLN
jgi:hypothetical protein